MPDVQLYLTHCVEDTIESETVIEENEGEKIIQQNYVYTNRKEIEVIMKPRICEVLRSRNGVCIILQLKYFFKYITDLILYLKQMGKWCILYMVKKFFVTYKFVHNTYILLNDLYII